ncbi:MAG: DUF5320 domain-containing protein [Candidatus Stahlbacteria bacterium]|nr:DUF5320 domain-containing protein [Candidatus Stahlbacteria bacterium]
MPRGDGTGPWGLGPMTGRAMGLCAGYPAPGYANPIPGRGGFGFGRGGWGRGRGFGRGRGWGRGFYGYGSPYMPYAYPGYAPYYSQPTAQEELQMLKDEAGALHKEMEVIETRMSELEKEVNR